MKKEEFFDIIGEIDEQKVVAAGVAMSAKRNNYSVWFKRIATVACMCFVVVYIFSKFPYKKWTENLAENPNWYKTHFETANLNEIEAVCGTDLLLDRLSMPGEYHNEYILEINEGGLFDNTADWNNLTVQLSNGKSKHDHTSTSVDYIFCFISFNGNTDAIDTSLWDVKSSPMEINDDAVKYIEKTNDEYAAEGITLGYKQNYHGYIVFTHNGYTYYLSTHSDNSEFFDNVISQMLESK